MLHIMPWQRCRIPRRVPPAILLNQTAAKRLGLSSDAMLSHKLKPQLQISLLECTFTPNIRFCYTMIALYYACLAQTS